MRKGKGGGVGRGRLVGGSFPYVDSRGYSLES